MKSGLDMIRDVHNRLLTIEGDLQGGKCWELHMTSQVVGINIVTNMLGLDNKMMQYGMPNINIHVLNAVEDLPNLQVFKPIIDKVTNLFESYWGSDFHTDIFQHAELRQQANKQWYANIKLNYYAIQKNKNI